MFVFEGLDAKLIQGHPLAPKRLFGKDKLPSDRAEGLKLLFLDLGETRVEMAENIRDFLQVKLLLSLAS